MSQSAILLVASDPDVLRGLLGEFPRKAWKPMAARAAAQVYQAVEARPPEVAVVHAALEDSDGAQLCQGLRQRLPELTIVLLTQDFPEPSQAEDPWDASIRYPTPPGVLADLVVAQLRARLYAVQQLQPFLEEIQGRAQAMDSQSYAQLLGVPQDATRAQVRQAYDALSLRYHPDRNQPLRRRAPEAFTALNDLYKRIGEAYRILTDPEKRIQYEKLLEQGLLRYDEAQRRTGPVSLEDLSENSRVKRFLKLAQSSKNSGNLRATLQNLRFAHSMERDNQDIADAIEEIQAQLP